MGFRLTSMGVGRLAAFVIVFGGMALWSVVRWLDHSFNYTQVSAIVDTVGDRCRPATRDPAGREALERSPLWRGGAWGSCRDARAWVRREPRAQITYSRVAEIRYVSPADGREHRGQLRLTGREQSKLAGGARVAILAHDSDPLAFEPA
jgi:hypothetical protein